MGKHKKSNKQVKNVFKVAGARSLKLKNKAKAVSVQLKKVSHGSIFWNIKPFFFVLCHFLIFSYFSVFYSYCFLNLCCWLVLSTIDICVHQLKGRRSTITKNVFWDSLYYEILSALLLVECCTSALYYSHMDVYSCYFEISFVSFGKKK